MARWKGGNKGHTRGMKLERGNGATYINAKGQKRMTRLYTIWCDMRKRGGMIMREGFSRDRHRFYYSHVTVCNEWAHSFAAFAFWAYLTGYADGLTIDRIDWRRGYCPENCRWATRAEQNREHRRPWGSVTRHGKPVDGGKCGAR